MSYLNWINVEEYPFNCMLLTERFQIRHMMSLDFPEWEEKLAVALKYNPHVEWYFSHRCPEIAERVESLVNTAPDGVDKERVRKAEIFVMGIVEDFVLHTTPEKMDTCCDYIYGWNKRRLLEMVDFTGKVVLDVGSGSGRLAFAAAEKAEWVYASEPVDTLREYLRDKIKSEKIPNVRVVDGMCDQLPYPDNSFDIVMSGHVVGDDYENEVTELIRVTKSGGWILSCPGDQPRKQHSDFEMIKRGFEELAYEGSFGEAVYRYRKLVVK